MTASVYRHGPHNVSNCIYHFVCPAKYRRVIFDDAVDKSLKDICEGIELRYDWIIFLEIGTDLNHVHFLIQSTPSHSPSEIIRTVKSITARQLFQDHPEIKKKLWGGNLWTEGFFVATVGRNTNEETIANYVKNQGAEEEQGTYRQLKLQLT